MKKARLYISVVEFVCPVCGESIPSNTVSFLFPKEEVPEILECECGEKLTVPKLPKDFGSYPRVKKI